MRRVKANVVVTASNHALVNMADCEDDLVIGRDVLAPKRSREDDNTFGGESGVTSGTSPSTEIDAEVVPGKTRRRRASHKTKPPKQNPLPFNQLSLALKSELRKLQHVAARRAVVSKNKKKMVCDAANKAIPLLQH